MTFEVGVYHDASQALGQSVSQRVLQLFSQDCAELPDNNMNFVGIEQRYTGMPGHWCVRQALPAAWCTRWTEARRTVHSGIRGTQGAPAQGAPPARRGRCVRDDVLWCMMLAHDLFAPLLIASTGGSAV